jgi:outer membrane protein OmpA-like peptidoglycan-associated protein
MKLKPAGKLAVLILAIGVGFGLWRAWQRFGGVLVPSAQTGESVVPGRADLPTLGSGQSTGSVAYTAPGTGVGCADKPEVRMLIWAWNAQMGLLLANGASQATTGSLMCKNGVNLKLIRQDDVSKMQAELVAFATELSQGAAQPSKGAPFVAIMGDGSAAFLKAVNDQLRRLGPEYVARVIGSCGYSRGEDKFMGPPSWKSNPMTSRGGVVAGVLRDGDWNIAQKWLGDNGLRTNPDEKTYDPDALNWVAANDYLDAGEKYVAGYTETRPVVRNGKRTGEMKQITVNGVVTWTPGDVNVAKKKGGLVSIVSTREYSSQMPNVIIGINKWMQQNRDTVQGMLKAVFQGGDQVKSSPDALRKASEISAQFYNEPNADAAYWERYYKGVTETDKTGLPVELGGSTVNNLADNLVLFGMVSGSSNAFAATYKVFGDIVVAQYRSMVPNYPPLAEILDISYLQNIVKKEAPTSIATQNAKPVAPNTPIKNPISRKSWYIRFDTGQASFRPDAQNELNKLLRELVIASSTAVEIHGHTDNVGNANTNRSLSEKRAFAVKRWLEAKAPVNFPQGRIRIFSHGQDNPVSPNDSEAGRSQNRRVEIVIGTTG